jgi:predicted phage terminase large subunit-like protein
MESDAYRRLFPGAVIPRKGAKDGNKKRTNDFFELVGRDGSYLSAGVDGGITGMGFVIGIIDDPHKNRKEAESLVMRDGAWEWYTSTFLSRMDEADAAIVLIMTRWHEDDLAGRLLELARTNLDADQWEVINLPAVMDKGAELTRTAGDERKTGEALWPDRFPEYMLKAMRASQGPYDWESLYQQRPFPPGGLKIKVDRFKYVNLDDVPANVRWAFFADLAVSSKTTADYTVIGMVGWDGIDRQIYLRDLLRYQKEWPASRKLMLGYLNRHKPSLGGIEKAGQQEGFIDDLNSEPSLQQIPLTLLHHPVDKDKLTRALPWIAKVDAGKFNIVNGAWVDDFIIECGKFTGADDRHDDQIDMVSGGFELVVSTYSNLTEMMVEHAPQLMRMLD